MKGMHSLSIVKSHCRLLDIGDYIQGSILYNYVIDSIRINYSLCNEV